MIPLIVLGALTVLPVVLALVLRVSSIFLFTSLLSGHLLLTFLGDDISLAASAFIRSATGPLYVQLAVLVLPLLLTLFVLRKTLPASKMILQFIPLLFVGLSVAVLALPLLPSDLQAAIFATQAGDLLRVAQDDIVGIAVLLHLVLLWLSYKKKPDEHKKHHK